MATLLTPLKTTLSNQGASDRITDFFLMRSIVVPTWGADAAREAAAPAAAAAACCHEWRVMTELFCWGVFPPFCILYKHHNCCCAAVWWEQEWISLKVIIWVIGVCACVCVYVFTLSGSVCSSFWSQKIALPCFWSYELMQYSGRWSGQPVSRVRCCWSCGHLSTRLGFIYMTHIPHHRHTQPPSFEITWPCCLKYLF